MTPGMGQGQRNVHVCAVMVAVTTVHIVPSVQRVLRVSVELVATTSSGKRLTIRLAGTFEQHFSVYRQELHVHTYIPKFICEFCRPVIVCRVDLSATKGRIDRGLHIMTIKAQKPRPRAK